MQRLSTVPLASAIRRGREEDAEQLAQLFVLSYQDASHECKDARYVRASLQEDAWYVYVEGDSIRACTGLRRHRWHQAYEGVGTNTHPAHRDAGLATVLLQKAFVDTYQQADCDMIFGFPRRRPMVTILSEAIEPPWTIVGHDGGLYTAHGGREYDLVALAFNPTRQISRVVPSGNAMAHSRFIQEQLLSTLPCATQAGTYPSPYIVGPRGTHSVQIGSSTVSYRYDPRTAALHITGLIDEMADIECVSRALTTFLAAFPTAQHIRAYVLIDKEELIGRMCCMGFDITAYLPAWYQVAQQRYDCVLLVQRNFQEGPVATDIQDMLHTFQHEFARWYRR